MNNIITQYNEWLMKQDITSMSNGLLSGKLGLHNTVRTADNQP